LCKSYTHEIALYSLIAASSDWAFYEEKQANERAELIVKKLLNTTMDKLSAGENTTTCAGNLSVREKYRPYATSYCDNLTL
jgi:hypothetical protein